MQAEYIITILVALLIFQHLFHMFNVHKLINKSLSRNFAEYAQVEKNRTEKVLEKKEIDLEDDYANAQAEKANRIFGLG